MNSRVGIQSYFSLSRIFELKFNTHFHPAVIFMGNEKGKYIQKSFSSLGESGLSESDFRNEKKKTRTVNFFVMQIQIQIQHLFITYIFMEFTKVDS